MNIKITSRKFKAKDSLKDYITEEVKSLERFNSSIIDVDIILSYTHPKDSIKNAEIILQIPGKIITVTDSSDEFEKAVSGALNKLVRQLSKVKTKRISRKKYEN